MFHDKWLTLVDREKNDMGIKGYLKCDIFMFIEGKSIDNLSLTKSSIPVVRDNEVNEKFVNKHPIIT